MKTYWVFYGNGSCGSCSGRSGVYSVRPGRPHPNCGCAIVKKTSKCEASGSGLGGARELGGGKFEQDILVEVTHPDGSITTDVITVEWDENMDPYDLMDGIHDALGDVADRHCAPFLCC